MADRGETAAVGGVAAASCAVTLWAQSEALEKLEVHSLGYRAANALVSYGEYLVATFWPANLALYYPHPRQGWPVLAVAVCGVALLGISAAAVWERRRWPYLFSGWFWYLGMLVPVIGLVQVGGQAMAHRYTYLPQIGLLLAVAWGADALRQRLRLNPQFAGAAAAAVVLALTVCAARQTTFSAQRRDLVAANHRLHDRQRSGPRQPGHGPRPARGNARGPGRVRDRLPARPRLAGVHEQLRRRPPPGGTCGRRHSLRPAGRRATAEGPHVPREPGSQSCGERAVGGGDRRVPRVAGIAARLSPDEIRAGPILHAIAASGRGGPRVPRHPGRRGSLSRNPLSPGQCPRGRQGL